MYREYDIFWIFNCIPSLTEWSLGHLIHRPGYTGYTGYILPTSDWVPEALFCVLTKICRMAITTCAGGLETISVNHGISWPSESRLPIQAVWNSGKYDFLGTSTNPNNCGSVDFFKVILRRNYGEERVKSETWLCPATNAIFSSSQYLSMAAD